MEKELPVTSGFFPVDNIAGWIRVFSSGGCAAVFHWLRTTSSFSGPRLKTNKSGTQYAICEGTIVSGSKISPLAGSVYLKFTGRLKMRSSPEIFTVKTASNAGGF